MVRTTLRDKIFRLRRKLYYIIHAKGRYGLHSQFAYDFYIYFSHSDKTDNIAAIKEYIDDYEYNLFQQKPEVRIITDINNSSAAVARWREVVACHNGMSIETFSVGIIINSANFATQNIVMRLWIN
jgi:hypothetical protein